MAEVTVKLRHLRQTPRKVRLITDLIRGRQAQEALNQLSVMDQRAAIPVRKLLVSGLSAAKAQGLDETSLSIIRVLTDQGPALKRRQINSRGRSSQIKKFMSHVTLTLAETNPKKGRK